MEIIMVTQDMLLPPGILGGVQAVAENMVILTLVHEFDVGLTKIQINMLIQKI